jgi:hypothetical protein
MMTHRSSFLVEKVLHARAAAAEAAVTLSTLVFQRVMRPITEFCSQN